MTFVRASALYDVVAGVAARRRLTAVDALPMAHNAEVAVSRIVDADGCERCGTTTWTRWYGARRLCGECVDEERTAREGPL
ncbi:hypothetical protein [Halostella pelagica]|uniref:hypothetical protein n=1 Tax=Halostella pelagica TaxID=2583824 RepID=UPI001080BF8F|nr:hypothetical protein [Halostella pelagica]